MFFKKNKKEIKIKNNDKVNDEEFNETVKNQTSTEDNSTDKKVFAKITPKKIEVKKDNTKPELPKKSSNSSHDEYYQKVDNIILSLRQLFAPFKEIIIKIVPFFKYFIWVIEQFFKLLTIILRFIAFRLPLFLKIARSKITIVFVVLFILLFFSGAFVTRLVNTSKYKHQIETAFYNALGYQVTISEDIRIRTFPTLSFSARNVKFLSVQMDNNLTITPKSLSLGEIGIKFKLLPLLLGRLEVKSIVITKPVVNLVLHSNYDNSLIINHYNNQINDIENALNSIIKINDNNKEQDIEATDNDTSKNSLTKLDNYLSDFGYFKPINEVKNINSNDSSDNNINIFTKLFSSVENFMSANDIYITRGKISVLDYSNNILFLFDNINLLHESNLLTSAKHYKGNLLYYKDLYYYDITLTQNKYDLKVSINDNFETEHNYIQIKGTKEDNQYKGNISSNGPNMQSILSNFFIDSDTFNKVSEDSFLKAKFSLNSEKLQMQDLNIKYFNSEYKGNFVWNFGRYGNTIDINISSDHLDFTDEDKIVNQFNGHKNIDYIMTTLNNWYNKSLVNFKSPIVNLNFVLNNLNFNGYLANQLNMNAFFANNNLYLRNFDLQTASSKLNISGKVLLKSNEAQLVTSLSGDNVNLLIPKDINYTFNGKNTNYSLRGKAVINSNKVIFSNINGILDNYEINNALLNFTDRGNLYELSLDLKLDNIDLISLLDSGEKYLTPKSISLVSDSISVVQNKPYEIKLNLSSNSLIYKDTQFKI